jgi:hypothetical protein
VQISSKTSLANHLELEIYAIANASEEDAEASIERLKRDLGEQHFQSGGGFGTIIFDPPSSSLLVSLSQQHQREVAQWLQADGKRTVGDQPRDGQPRTTTLNGER